MNWKLGAVLPFFSVLSYAAAMSRMRGSTLQPVSTSRDSGFMQARKSLSAPSGAGSLNSSL